MSAAIDIEGTIKKEKVFSDGRSSDECQQEGNELIKIYHVRPSELDKEQKVMAMQ
jgi:hypothetical protein